ncbi:MAG: hypothetical protein WD960_03105 [Gemmatimonadota bacterium]
MPQSKKSGAFSLPLMIVAFLAIAGFLYWLSITSEPTEFAVAEETLDDQFGPALDLTLEQFGENVDGYVDSRIRISDVQVRNLVGADAFWFSFPQEDVNDYLVRVDRSRVASDFQILPDDRLTVSGTVHAMTDSVIDAWEQAGVFQDEGQRPAVLVLESFLQADSIGIHADAGGAAGEEDGEEAEDGN